MQKSARTRGVRPRVRLRDERAEEADEACGRAIAAVMCAHLNPGSRRFGRQRAVWGDGCVRVRVRVRSAAPLCMGDRAGREQTCEDALVDSPVRGGGGIGTRCPTWAKYEQCGDLANSPTESERVCAGGGTCF